jgi:hypothetical protein
MPYPALAARRSDCGSWPKARMKARRIQAWTCLFTNLMKSMQRPKG